MINGYQGNISQISIKYQTDFSRILNNICWIYPNISQISEDSGQIKILEKSLKTAMFRPNPTARYQPDIKAFCTTDIKSCHPLSVYFTINRKLRLNFTSDLERKSLALSIIEKSRHILRKREFTWKVNFTRIYLLS